jgi:lipopolysaccharide transport system permease protein
MKEVVVYEPNQRVTIGFFNSWRIMVKRLFSSRELIWQLFKRDLSNYKQSYLGMFWIFLSPVIAIISWVFLNATGILKPGDVGVPYPVYVLVGGAIWGLFMDIYAGTARSLADSSALIMQVNFPHEALVGKQAARTIVFFVINLLLIIVVLAIYKLVPGPEIALLPLVLLPLFLVGTGIGMIVSVLLAVAHDFEKAVTALLGFLMYLTPVIYSPRYDSPIIKILIKWNPLGYLISAPRDVILYKGLLSPKEYAISAILGVLFFLCAWRIFFLSEYKVAERL